LLPGFSLPLFYSSFFHCSGHHRALHSFPTRRSSDLLTTEGLGRPASPLRSRTLPGWAARCSLEVIMATTTVLRVVRLNRSCCRTDRKSTRLNSSHVAISYAVFCLKKKKKSTR